MGADSIEKLLQRLRQLHRLGAVPVEAGGRLDWYETMLFPPATESEVRSAQLVLGKRLPEDFRAFWRRTNGANLFVNESGLHGVGVASTSLMADLQKEEAEHYGAEALAPYAVFARVNGGGDFLAFRLEDGRVVDGVHAEEPHEWRAIASSFSEWLSRFIAVEGRYYWLEALYDASGPELGSSH